MTKFKMARLLYWLADLIVGTLVASHFGTERRTHERSDCRQGSRPCTHRFHLFNEEIAALVRARMPLESHLSRIGAELPGKSGELADRIGRRLATGESFARAMEVECAAMPAVYRATIVAGVESGHLGNAIESLVDTASRMDQLRRITGVSLLYPIVILLATCLLLAMVIIRVVPQFEWLDRFPFWTNRLVVALAADSLSVRSRGTVPGDSCGDDLVVALGPGRRRIRNAIRITGLVAWNAGRPSLEPSCYFLGITAAFSRTRRARSITLCAWRPKQSMTFVSGLPPSKLRSVFIWVEESGRIIPINITKTYPGFRC